MLGRIVAFVALLLSTLVRPAVAADGCAPEAHLGGEWRSFGHDLANTRHQPDSNIEPLGAWLLFAPDWTFASTEGGGDGDFSGTPIVADGCVFAGSNTGWVFALDADTGDTVWATKLDGPIKSSAAVSGGLVYVTVSRIGSPFAAALDVATGETIWTTTLDEEPGAESYGSPVVYDGMVFAGVSGVSPESDDADPALAHHGSFSLLDAASGAVLKKTYSIPPELWADGYGGGGFWPTPAVDEATGYAYAATGNPFRDDREHANVNAIVKIDLDRSRPTFGEIVGSFKPPPEAVPGTAQAPPCEGTDRLPVAGPGGDAVVPHLDFGASPNLFRDASGRLLVGDGQKSGVYHALDAETMQPVWETLAGPYGPFGGIVSSAAFDGTTLYGGVTPAGYLFALDRESGDCRWVTPVADGVHYGHPVASSNGVIYTLDAKGFLDAYGAGNGFPLFPKPMWFGTSGRPAATFGGVSVARDTIFAAVGLQVADGIVGSILAYR